MIERMGMMLLTALAVPVAAGAQTLVNGGFETYQGLPGAPGVRDLAGANDVDGWTLTGENTYYEANGNDGIDAAGDGTHWLAFGHNGATGATLSQVIQTVLGTSYTVNYLIRQQQGLDDVTFFTVGIDGGPSVVSGTPGLDAWTAGTALTFVGTGGAMTLRFTDSTPFGANSNLALDAVTLSAATAPTGGVPEPATWAMMLLGFGGLGHALRDRRAARARIRFA